MGLMRRSRADNGLRSGPGAGRPAGQHRRSLLAGAQLPTGGPMGNRAVAFKARVELYSLPNER